MANDNVQVDDNKVDDTVDDTKTDDTVDITKQSDSDFMEDTVKEIKETQKTILGEDDTDGTWIMLQTISGLAGLGDLIATCASPLSRNHYVGVELTKGRSLKEITDSMTGVAEGVTTTVVAWNLAQ